MEDELKIDQVMRLYDEGWDIDSIMRLTGCTKHRVMQYVLENDGSFAPIPHGKKYMADFTRDWNRITSRLKRLAK